MGPWRSGSALPWHGRGRGFDSRRLHTTGSTRVPYSNSDTVKNPSKVGRSEWDAYFGHGFWRTQRAVSGPVAAARQKRPSVGRR